MADNILTSAGKGYSILVNEIYRLRDKLKAEDASFLYAFYNIFLFSEECEAWVHGPVYRDIYFRYRDYRFDPIEGNDEFDDSVFTSETPWLSARGELSPTTASDRTIEKELIGTYFSAVKEKYNMINTNDIKGYAQKMFEQM